MKKRFFLLFASLAVQVFSVRAGIREEVEARIRLSGAGAGLAFGTLDGGQELFIREETVFHAASTMKVPVMMELFRQAGEGVVDLEETLEITNRFHSIVDGSTYELDPADDSDSRVYGALGTRLTLRQLCESMITASSNLATNLLIEKLGVEEIRRTVEQYGGRGLNVLRGVEDARAYREGLNNTTTARALFQLMKAIAERRVVSRPASQTMIEILSRQEFNEGIPSGLPEGTVVAHKTGQITGIHHDAGIVFCRNPFVLVILLRGIESSDESARLIGDLTRMLYDWSNPR